MVGPRLAWALVAVIVRYLTTIQPHAKRELARWRQHALAIPDPELRAHVLRPFDVDGSAIGASLFAVLAPLRMQRRLVRLLIAYVLLWSYVDVCTERDSDADPRLYDALVDALRPRADSAVLPDLGDAGYLAALFRNCRSGCVALPGWSAVESTVLGVAGDGRVVQAISHGLPAVAEARLRAWAACRPGRPWYERCAAASSPLAIHAVMAVGAHSATSSFQAAATARAYESVSALGVFCDHTLDQAEDEALHNHSFLGYAKPLSGHARVLYVLADHAARSVRGLPTGERHAVIVAAMTVMFLSKSGDALGIRYMRATLHFFGPPAPQFAAVLRFARWLGATARCLAGRARSSATRSEPSESRSPVLAVGVNDGSSWSR